LSASVALIVPLAPTSPVARLPPYRVLAELVRAAAAPGRERAGVAFGVDDVGDLEVLDEPAAAVDAYRHDSECVGH
jgi:hypothetical protein